MAWAPCLEGPGDNCLEAKGKAQGRAREPRSEIAPARHAPLVGSWPDKTLAAPMEVCPSLQAQQRSGDSQMLLWGRPIHLFQEPPG